MAQHASKSSHLQLVELPKSVAVQVPLPVLGALASAENAFFDLCIDVGQQVFSVLMEQDRESLCGPKGKHDADRSATRAGSTSSDITLGGRRIPVRRLRARSVEGEELGLPSFAFAADRDPLDRQTMEAIACGVSTRKYRRSLEKLSENQKERSTSKSAVSRRFVALSQKQMTAWLSAPLSDLDVRVLVIDGIVFHDHTVIIVLGIDSDGKKHVLGLREGTTENSGVAKALFRDLLDRGLDPDRARLFVVDGSKALKTAIRKVFGRLGVRQRCQIHKRRNILEHLPEHRHASVDRILREAWDSPDADLAKRRLESLASSLEAEHPGAAGSIREGLDETLTLQRLGIEGALYQTLRSTNTIENLNGLIATYTRNVKRWQGGSMVLRWASAAVLDASKRFRRIRGYRDLDRLTRGLEQIEQEQETATDQQVA
ncbi:MAG: IS256 family transposase [Myxococcales bacterium]|nr:IS256 family transposase [Myxococcales bacterium]